MSRRARERAHARPWIDAAESSIDWAAVSADIGARAYGHSPRLAQTPANSPLGTEFRNQSPLEGCGGSFANSSRPSGRGQFETGEVVTHQAFLSSIQLGHEANCQSPISSHGYDFTCARLMPGQQEQR